MGKFSRSWELVKQSFAILRSDKQLMLFPVFSAIACLIVTAVIATGGAVLMLPAMTSAAATGERFNPNQSPVFLLGMFSLYVANYFVIVFFNVALVGVANSRLMGGTWTFRDGIDLAWARKGTILQWALVAATVGVILRTIEERMGFIGRMIMRLIGIAWTLACYFVVPVLAFEDLTPIEAVKRSSKLFRDTWGEKVIGGFSLSLVSLVLMLPGIGLWFAAAFVGGLKGLLIGTVLMILYFLMLSVFMSAVQGVFNAALYRYACFKQVPPAFSQDLIASAWAPQNSWPACCNPGGRQHVLRFNRVLAYFFHQVFGRSWWTRRDKERRALRNEISSCRRPCAMARTGWESLRSLWRFCRCCC
jgi:hypothetical protein